MLISPRFPFSSSRSIYPFSLAARFLSVTEEAYLVVSIDSLASFNSR